MIIDMQISMPVLEKKAEKIMEEVLLNRLYLYDLIRRKKEKELFDYLLGIRNLEDFFGSLFWEDKEFKNFVKEYTTNFIKMKKKNEKGEIYNPPLEEIVKDLKTNKIEGTPLNLDVFMYLYRKDLEEEVFDKENFYSEFLMKEILVTYDKTKVFVNNEEKEVEEIIFTVSIEENLLDNFLKFKEFTMGYFINNPQLNPFIASIILAIPFRIKIISMHGEAKVNSESFLEYEIIRENIIRDLINKDNIKNNKEQEISKQNKKFYI